MRLHVAPEIIRFDDGGAKQLTIHMSNEVDADGLGTLGFAFTIVSAASESFLLDLIHHFLNPLVSFGLPLWEQREVRHLGRGIQHGGSVWAGRHARSATDAG